MAISEKVGRYYLGAPYKKDHGPDSIGSKDLEREGLNCQAFVHLFYSDVLGLSLTPEMKSKEISEDEKTFRTVHIDETPAIGDVYCLGSVRTRPKGFHLAVVVGFEEEVPVLRHANKRDGQVSDATLLELQRRYGVVHAVKRLKDPEQNPAS